MTPRQFLLGFVGAFAGVLVGELGTFPVFASYFQSAPGSRFPSPVEMMSYFALVAVVFVIASHAFLGGKAMNLRNGARVGFVYSLALGLTFAGVLVTFSSYDPMYVLGAFLTQLVNYTAGGAIAGYLSGSSYLGGGPGAVKSKDYQVSTVGSGREGAAVRALTDGHRRGR